MSRSRSWQYTIGAPNHGERWEAFFTLGPGAAIGIGTKFVPTGFGNGSQSDIVLYANRSKARRIAALLDDWCGAPGRLEPVDLDVARA
jgi:hypothetical protein